jgi:pimeloyl-ACP methyl ester carboxylesterase
MTTYLLIAGGGGDPWEWHRLVPELEARGHEAIAVRLPVEDDDAGWSDYADAVIEAAAGRDRVTVVAASMGGFTAPIVCARRPVELLVLVNAMIPRPGETFDAWWSSTGWASARRAYHASIGLTPDQAEDDDAIYYHDLPAPVRAEAGSRTWQGQSETPLHQPWPLAAWPAVPTRVLVGRIDRMFPADFQRRIARERLDLEVEEIDGGHMVALSAPVGVADRLERYRSPGRAPQGGFAMTDRTILEHINELAHEEEELWLRAGHSGGLDGADKDRLDRIAVELDQAYDLLRQRQAKREFGQDPDEAEIRPEDVVEHYQQ